jgi:hypothetical protein
MEIPLRADIAAKVAQFDALHRVTIRRKDVAIPSTRQRQQLVGQPHCPVDGGLDLGEIAAVIEARMRWSTWPLTSVSDGRS